MNILRFGLRGLVATGVIVLLVGIIGAGAATSGTSPLTNAKHFFWAQGQAPAASVDTNALQNDLIYHGGNVGPGAIGVEQKPAVYLIWWGPHWKSGFTTAGHERGHVLEQDAPDLPAVVLPERRRQRVGEHPDAVLRRRAARLDELRRRRRVRHEPEGPAQGRLDRSRHRCRTTSSRSVSPRTSSTTRSRARPFGPCSTSATTRGDLHHPHAADHDRDRRSRYYCGYHTQTSSVDGLGNTERIQYAFIPWLNQNWPASGTGGCGMHNVNATSDSFGNGVFDG